MKRALGWVAVVGCLAVATHAWAQASAPPPRPGLVAQARIVARDQLHLSIDGATASLHASTLAEVRRDRAAGGRFAFFPGRAEMGNVEGDELIPVWIIHLARPRPAGTEGAIVVFDLGGYPVAAWELFSPD